ncbi:CHRD domain-containing protein, partial [Escherichia coli]|uniref:CHRD domain-containing protein n=1 Tax=Escherichia coli TaxID=562 RepID=UPI00312CC165
PVVVPLRTPNADGTSSGCAPVARTLVTAILADPGSYYLNVHTSEFTAGAVRGQLTGTSTASFGWIVAVDLKGTSEPNANGTAVVRIRARTPASSATGSTPRTSRCRRPRHTFIAGPRR